MIRTLPTARDRRLRDGRIERPGHIEVTLRGGSVEQAGQVRRTVYVRRHLRHHVFQHGERDFRTTRDRELEGTDQLQILIGRILHDRFREDDLVTIRALGAGRTQEVLNAQRLGLNEPGRDILEHILRSVGLLKGIGHIGGAIGFSEDNGHLELQVMFACFRSERYC